MPNFFLVRLLVKFWTFSSSRGHFLEKIKFKRVFSKTWFTSLLQRCIQNLVKYLRWGVLTASSYSMLDIWLGSGYPPMHCLKNIKNLFVCFACILPFNSYLLERTIKPCETIRTSKLNHEIKTKYKRKKIKNWCYQWQNQNSNPRATLNNLRQHSNTQMIKRKAITL